VNLSRFRAFRGSGTAERLYRALNDHFRAIRVPAYRIVVGESLLPAHRFYTRMGAKPVETVRIHGASYMCKTFENDGASLASGKDTPWVGGTAGPGWFPAVI